MASLWYQVQLDVAINEWFGNFYDTVQKALSGEVKVTEGELFGVLFSFSKIAGIYVFVAVFSGFFIKHYVFRWRTAMNDYYVANWQRLKHIEGASQRIQEDTSKFANIVESLGERFISSLLTLIAFLPLLWGLSMHVKSVPVFGELPHALVYAAIIFAAAGTVLLALVGIKLPGLEFNNQVVEAAYRKELVLGEDNDSRGQPPTLKELYNNVRKNYYRLFMHYMYFDIAKYSYLQFGVIVPYLILVPSLASAAFTLGIMQQIVRAFGRVESSFQYLVYSWSTIVQLISIYKRLKAFEQHLKEDDFADDSNMPVIET
jgi:peptide/bleomycin uptake transporter